MSIELPDGTDIVRHELDDGFTLTVPAAGLVKGSKGLFVFAIIWDLFITIFAVVMVLAMSGKLPSDSAPPKPVALLFLVPFFAVGLGLFLASIRMGLTRVLIAVTGDLLAIRRVSPFGTKEYRLEREEIQAIRSGPSGMRVNDVPVIELQIHRADGKTIRLLSQRANAELDWIAAQLRQGVFRSGGSAPASL